MEEKLIRAVKCHICLFGKSHLFRNKFAKEKTWQKVSESVVVSENNNVLHAASHSPFRAHQSFLPHPRNYSSSLIYSDFAYAYQQLFETEQDRRQQSASEVLDLSRRDSAMVLMPSPYKTNSSVSAESPTGSPTHHQQKQNRSQPNSLYDARQKKGQIGPPLASLCPAFYASIDLANDVTAGITPPLPSAVTPPSSNELLYTAQSQSSPISNNSLAIASAVAPAAVVAGTTLNSMLLNIKTEAMHMAPLSPISSHDDYSNSPSMQAANVSPNNTTPPSSNSALNALKSTRPFKAFPRDPLVIAANFAATDVLLDNPRGERYAEYRKRMLQQIHSSNGGARTITNPKMRRMNSRRNSSSSNEPETVNSEGEERHGAGADESNDCDSSYAGTQADKTSSSAHANNGEENNNKNGPGGQIKDAAYYERRRKNNAAAKKSRDRRRIKEDEIAIRAAYLERQNIELLCQIDALKAQLTACTSKTMSL